MRISDQWHCDISVGYLSDSILAAITALRDSKEYEPAAAAGQRVGGDLRDINSGLKKGANVNSDALDLSSTP